MGREGKESRRLTGERLVSEQKFKPFEVLQLNTTLKPIWMTICFICEHKRFKILLLVMKCFCLPEQHETLGKFSLSYLVSFASEK